MSCKGYKCSFYVVIVIAAFFDVLANFSTTNFLAAEISRPTQTRIIGYINTEARKMQITLTQVSEKRQMQNFWKIIRLKLTEQSEKN